jgi:hypothetical protein
MKETSEEEDNGYVVIKGTVSRDQIYSYTLYLLLWNYLLILTTLNVTSLSMFKFSRIGCPLPSTLRIERLFTSAFILSHQRKLLWLFNADRHCTRKSTKIFGRWQILLTQPVGTLSKCTKDAENVYLGPEKDTCRPDSLMDRLIPILTHLCFH